MEYAAKSDLSASVGETRFLPHPLLPLKMSSLWDNKVFITTAWICNHRAVTGSNLLRPSTTDYIHFEKPFWPSVLLSKLMITVSNDRKYMWKCWGWLGGCWEERCNQFIVAKLEKNIVVSNETSSAYRSGNPNNSSVFFQWEQINLSE